MGVIIYTISENAEGEMLSCRDLQRAPQMLKAAHFTSDRILQCIRKGVPPPSLFNTQRLAPVTELPRRQFVPFDVHDCREFGWKHGIIVP